MSDTFGNNLLEANRIFPIASSQTFTESIGVDATGLDANDYYVFTLNRSSSVTLSLTGLSADANLEVGVATGDPANPGFSVITDTDPNLNTILLRSTNAGTLTESINAILDPGTYYVRVFPGQATTPSTAYNLNIAATSNATPGIVWRNYVTTDNSIWTMNGASRSSFAILPSVNDLNWRLEGTGDFNGDGKTDLLWRNYGTTPGGDGGKNAIWYLDGTVLSSFEIIAPAPDLNWQIEGTGFFNGDQFTDILWRNYATNQTSVWFMNGSSWSTFAFVNDQALPGWRVQGTADFNNDGKTDILWRDFGSTSNQGSNFVWLMDGTTRTNLLTLPSQTDLNWDISGAGDYNSDGRPDLLWRNRATGLTQIWFLNGSTLLSSDTVTPSAPLTDLGLQAVAPFEQWPATPFRTDIAGNATANSFSIGNLTGSGSYIDSASPTDVNDYYRFSVNGPTNLRVSLAGVDGGAFQGDLDIQILNTNNSVVQLGGTPLESLSAGNVTEQIQTPVGANLPAGNYFIRVFAKPGESSFYRLSLEANSLPVVATKSNLVVSEGTTGTISSTLLNVTDANNTPDQLTFTLIDPPDNGTLSLNGAAIGTGNLFTQADINAGRLTYGQNGSETLTDTFAFSVTDGTTIGTLTNQTFTINVTPVNDLPLLVSNNPLAVSEGASAAIDGTRLLMTDIDNTATELIYSLNTTPTNGVLLLAGRTLTAGLTFTQADVAAGNRLSYFHNGSETASDSFNFTALDVAGGTVLPTPQTFSIAVAPVNDAPALVTNAGLTLNQDQSLAITSAVLRVTDAEFNTSATEDLLVYTVNTAPSRGTLFVNGTQTNTFTQGDLNNGRVLYDHDGSPTNSDRFTFNVTDGTTPIGPFTFNMTVIAANFPPALITNNPLTLSEGTALAIGQTLLQTTDRDTPPPSLLYTLTSAPTTGQLRRDNADITIGQTFSQSDIDNSRLSYRHNGSETTSDLFTFTVSDGAGNNISTQTFSINVLPVNDAPLLATNAGLTISEGAALVVDTSLLQATDVDNSSSQITYSIATGPASGTLILAGNTAPATFTQSDINNGLLRYQHNGSESTADSFVFNVSDGTVAIGLRTFNIAVVPVNDPPLVVTNTPLTLNEGATAAINTTLTTRLLVTDDDGANTVTLTLAQAPTRGQLLRGSTTLTAGQFFTPADLSTLIYTHNGSETTSDSFVFAGSDGSTGVLPLTTFSIAVTPVNDTPVLISNPGLSLSEAGTVQINNTLLLTTDAETTIPANIRYTVTTAPTSGTLLLSGVQTSAFTQADLNNGLVQYRHRGTETIADSFTFDVTDGTQTLAAQVVNIAIAPVNDNPGIFTNAGLTVAEGAPPVTIDGNILQLTDDDGPGPIVYTLASTPNSGTLLLGATALSVGQFFTQDQINSNLLRYANSGSETTSDRFTFTASDSSTGSLALTTFTIGITPVDDPPVLISNVGLSLTEGGITTISNALLLASDAETPLANNIRYNIGTAPPNGTVLLSGTQTNTFTQADINAGLVRYRHNGQETIADSFTFDITAGALSLTGQTFNIAVTPVNDNPALVGTNSLSIAEGDPPIIISSSALQLTDVDGPGPLLYTLVGTTTSGTLLLSGVSLSAGQTFSQSEVDNGLLVYTNNGSETTSDRFTFTASDSSTGTLPLTTFSIAIAPVNDTPVLLSNNGLTLSEGGLSSIVNSLLAATDAETPLASNLRYNIITGPINGTLLRAGVQTTSFTQADLNGGLIQYRHRGTETVSDSFTFDVFDGVQTLAAQVFNIAINPVNDAPGISTSANLLLPVTEGGPAVTITSTNLQITDNDGPGPLTYTIGTAPARGTLFLAATTPLTSGQTFTQDDIDNNLLSYLHNGSETTSDTFTFTASDGSTGTIPSTVFSIGVTPVNDAPILTAPGTVTVNEDGVLAFTGANVIQVRDVDNTSLSVTLNTAATAGRLSINPGSLTVTGQGTNNLVISGALTALNSALTSLTFRGVPDFNGPAAIEVIANDGALTDTRTIDLTVVPVNDTPTLTVPVGTVTVNEDTSVPLAGITVTDVDSDTNAVRAVISVSNGGLTINDTSGITFEGAENGAGTLTLTGAIASIQTALSSLNYQGNPNYFGTDTLTILIDDQGGTGTGGPRTVTRTIPISVTSVNDRPTFTAGTDITVLEDAGARTFAGWATNILPGPGNESTQTVNFAVTGNTNAALFAVAPTISSNGTLSFTPAANANGTAQITVELRDNGGGTNASIPVTFQITITPVNDAPTFTAGPSQTIGEDAGLRTVNNWATGISSGPADESGQTLTFDVDTNNLSLFTLAPTISPTGTLTYQVAPNTNGTAIVTVRLRDSGGTENGGVDTSPLRTFTITANAVNDAPILTVPGAQTTNEDEVLTITGVTFNDVDAGNGNVQVQLAASNGVIGITSTPGVTLSNNNVSNVILTGRLDALTTALSSFTYRGNANFEGTDTLTITISDLGNTGSGGTLTDTDTIDITVNAVNDAPTVTVPTNALTIQEDTDLVLAGINVTDPDAANGNVRFTIAAQNGTLNFTNTAGVTSTGNGSNTVTLEGTLAAIRPLLTTTSNLRYRGNSNYNGPDLVTVTLNDLSNTGSGGPLTDTRSFSVNVTAVNDLPTLTLPTGPLTLNEDDPTGLVFTQGTPTEILLTDVDSGSNPVRVSLSVNRGTLNLTTTNGLTPLSGANGTNTFTFTGTVANVIAALDNLNYRSNANFNGQDVLTITVNDQGNTGSGVTPAPNVARSLTINVTAVNDTPVLVSNRGLTLNEGDTLQILNSLLNTTDVDATDTPATDTPDQIIYTLVNAPNTLNGRLLLVAGTTTTLGNGGTFSQADINAGRLRYAHSGSESPTDSFTFRVSDGDVTIPDATSTYTFNVTVNPRNDIPVVTTNVPLNLSEGEARIISNALLRTTDPDNTAAQLRYTLTSVASNGVLLLNGSTLSVNQSFTQADINLGGLSYQHSGNESTSDSFNFFVRDTSGGITAAQRFTIQVASVNDQPIIVSRGPLTLSEGAEVAVTSNILRTIDPDGPQPLTYRLTDTPITGELRRNGVVLNANETFTQQDIDLGLITYRHNDGEVFEDVINVAVSDNGFTSFTRTFIRVSITPINDPPRLTTNLGLTVDGTTQNTVTPIGPGLLRASDADTTDQNLRYILSAVPNSGVGVLQLNGVALEVGDDFTQADVNAGRLTFRYFSGGFSESFQFTVEDESLTPTGTEFFNILFDYSGS